MTIPHKIADDIENFLSAGIDCSFIDSWPP
jgi:hypothetical protein